MGIRPVSQESGGAVRNRTVHRHWSPFGCGALIMDTIELRKIVRLHRLWLDGDMNGVRADLSGANLRNADLSDADLRNADLSDADLSNANLRNADWRNADLSNANLRNADLSNADLSNANLRNADLSNANLTNANLRNANLTNADLSGANLSNANLRYADLSGANLSNADLSDANLRYTVGDGSIIRTIQTGIYTVVIYGQIVSIDRQSHNWSDWMGFNDTSIHNMDGQNAVDFWRAWKPILTAIMEVR
jgi:uncharacterized protein YjbI with pentapeptide repeats